MDEIVGITQHVRDSKFELISNCKHCTLISTEPNNRTPIYCTKFSGSVQPISVNLNTCITCKEYEQPQKL